LVAWHERVDRGRGERRVAEVGEPGQPVDLEQPGQVERAGGLAHVGQAQVQPVGQEHQHVGRGVGVDLQPHRVPAPPRADVRLDLFE
jgi:hypothetical protein